MSASAFYKEEAMSKKTNRAAPARATTMSKARAITGAILTIVLLALIGFGIWFVLDRTNYGTEDFRAFAVTVDGKEVKSTNERRSLLQGEHTVSASYLLGGDFDYTVDIVPAGSFNYKTDEVWHRWGNQQDLTKAFSLEKEEKGFSFTVPKNLATVLATLYPGADIVAPKESELQDPYIYTLVISSYNEKMAYAITFSIAIDIDGVDTNKPEVQFP